MLIDEDVLIPPVENTGIDVLVLTPPRKYAEIE
jgi:hypothetical protein